MIENQFIGSMSGTLVNLFKNVMIPLLQSTLQGVKRTN